MSPLQLNHTMARAVKGAEPGRAAESGKNTLAGHDIARKGCTLWTEMPVPLTSG